MTNQTELNGDTSTSPNFAAKPQQLLPAQLHPNIAAPQVLREADVAAPPPGMLRQDINYFDSNSFASVHSGISDFLVAPIGMGNHISALMNGIAMSAYAFRTVNGALGNDVYPNLMAYLGEFFPQATIVPNVTYENGDLQTFYILVTQEEVVDGGRNSTFHTLVYGATTANFVAMVLPSHVDFAPHEAFFNGFKPPKEFVIKHFDGKGTNSHKLKKESCIVHPEFYPYLGTTPHDLIEGFYRSRSSILILTGLAGTGKSSLARSFLNHSEGEFFMVDNPIVYNSPDSFIALMGMVTAAAQNATVTLFLDEMDGVITKEKEDDATGVVARLLSMSSGIIELNLKIVITSNLMNQDKINANILRGGRTYRAIDFGKLSPDEADVARSKIGLPPANFTEPVTLASALNFESDSEIPRESKRGFGFLSK